jgi:hypothetical protein
MSRSRYEVIASRVAFKYQDIGHAAGDKIWWVDNSGKVQSVVSTGKEFHHDLSRLDMDLRWRGRLDRYGVATLLPPVKLYAKYSPEEMPLPESVMLVLERMGAKIFWLDTQMGMKRISSRK